MFTKVVLLAAISLSIVQCEPPIPQYGVPFNNGGGALNGGGGFNGGGYNDFSGNNGGVNGNYQGDSYGNSYNGHGDGGDNGHDHGGEPKSYEFGYQVKDDYTGTNYNRQEQSDGNQVTGSYRVALPDGRIQIVTYVADWRTGFHADVKYEGEAQYPEVYNTNNGYASNHGYNQGPTNQYGPPVNPIAINNQYAPPSTNYGSPNGGSSSVSIKDFSGPGTPFNTGNDFNSGYQYNNPSSGYSGH